MPKLQQKGNLIVLYGVNNLGKTTQAKLLVENIIIKMSKNAEYFKYPVYTLEPSGPLITDYLRQGNKNQFTAREFQMLQVLNRTQYENTLKAKLNDGTWIVAEDYVGTGVAWGMAEGLDKNLLYRLNSHLYKEDLGILFEGKRFEGNLDKNNSHETNPALMEKAMAAFTDISKDFNWHIINANQSIEAVQEEVLQIIKSKLAFLE